MERTPLHSEAELREHDRKQQRLLHASDMVQRLTFFVISIELIACGYLLLNASTLREVNGSLIIYLSASLAALCGLLWRVFYNEHTHAAVTERNDYWSMFTDWMITPTYWAYVILSLIFFISIIVFGTYYIA